MTGPIGVTGPIAVGGLGGSGTRVVAEILQQLGVYIGADIGPEGDNLWFPCLVTLPEWELETPDHRQQAVYRSIALFEQAMTGTLKPTRAERKAVEESVERSFSRWKEEDRRDRQPRWFRQRLDALVESRRAFPADASRWGWKEPATHYFLPYLDRYFGPRLQYVHVIRHGLYMARSTNQTQFRRWGSRYGIDPGGYPTEAAASLAFWIAANRRAIDQGASMAHFYLLNYDALCADPAAGVAALLDFLEIDPPPPVVERLAALPRARPRQYPAGDLDGYTAEQLQSVVDLGFALD